MMQLFKDAFNAIYSDYLLLFFTGIMLLLIMPHPVPVAQLAGLIHFPTLFTLIILLIITTGTKESELLQYSASLALHYIDTKRRLGAF